VGPNPDRAAARRLGETLSSIGYTEDAIDELLGDDAWSAAIEDVPAHARRLERDPLGIAIRLFFLELPVSARDAERTLGKRGVAALVRTGLAEERGEVVPRARVAPVDGLLVASDRLSTNPSDDPPDYVATYSPTARLCDLLTPRPRVAAALDVGTGNGVHALLAARHSSHAVATDVNGRALAFTALNAALSGLDNVECRLGSLYDPAGAECFGLITCNAPYVVSPERRWTYRDGAFEGDLLSEHVVRDAGAHLADGGYATLCVTWLARDEDEPDERVAGWVDGSGCDSWILPIDEATPLQYAERWNSHLAGDPAAYGEALDRWTSYLDGLGARLVVEGTVILRRRTGGNTVRIDEIDEDELDVADAQIRRAFEARARLDGLDIRDARLEPALALRVETRTRRGRAVGSRVVLEEGTWPELAVPGAAADVVAALDGQRTLRELSAPSDAVSLCRELLELGALRLVGFGAPS
jgi:methylase of polypeptide subunit release factors